MTRILGRMFFLVCYLTLCQDVFAQPVPSREPSSTHIFPAGGRRGTTVKVLVGGECIPPETGFRIWGEGVTVPASLGPKVAARLEPSPRRDPREVPICYPKEWESTIDIRSDAPLGPCLWRLTCARGGTGSRPFIVGDLPEFIETESNSSPDRSERVDLPVTLNGRIAGESDLDYFVFAARAADIILCDVVAGRIGSPLDPVIELTGPDGGPVALDEIRLGSDPVLAFRAPATGDYRLFVSNVSFHGGPAHLYRITLLSVAALSEPAARGILSQLIDRGLVPSIGRPILNDAATARVSGHEVTSGGEAASEARVAELPAMIRGRLRDDSHEQWFRFAAKKGQTIAIDCRAYPAGSAILPELTLVDGNGSTLAECKTIEAPDRLCQLDWQVPADGEFRIRLRDAWQGARSPSVGYELVVRPAEPDFSLQLKSDCINVVQGGRAELEVKVRRRGGFDGAIAVSVEGLPNGVQADPVEIAAKQEGCKLILVADTAARPADAVLHVAGRASIGGMPIQRIALGPQLGRDVDGTAFASAEIDRCFLTVQHKPIFRLFCNEAYQYAHRGTIYPYLMQVERLDGFDGEITIQLGDRQNRDLDGVQFIEVKVPPGVTEARVPIYLPESMHINVLSQSQIYAQAYAFFTDQWGQRQSTLVVSEKRNMIRTMPTVVKLTAADKELHVRPGMTAVCRLELDRTSNFTGAVEVELVEPHAASGFSAQNARIERGEQSAEVVVQVPDDFDGEQATRLLFRARGQLAPDVAVVSEATIALKFDQ